MKKNYFLHTAILLVALVCGTVPVWSQTYKKISSIDELTDGKYVIAYGEEYAMTNENAGKFFTHTSISPIDNEIISPDASIIWEIATTANGKSIKNGNIYVGFNGTKNTATAYSSFTAQNCEFTFSYKENVFLLNNVSSTDFRLQYNTSNPRFACYTGSQKDLTLYKLEETGKTNPELAFTGITGDITKMLSDGSYSSKATTKSDATIVYSSSNQEVATIDQQGLVTLLAGGTTVIKAEVKETSTYKSEVIQYTLTVKEPTIITGTVTFNDWSKIKKGSGNGYVAYEGDQIFVGDDEKDYVWNFYQIMPSTNAETKDWPQAQKEAGKLISPAFETTKGFTYTITFKGGEVTLTGSDGKTVTGASPLSFTTSATNCTVTMSNPTATTYIEKIVIDASTLEDPALAFPENITTQTVKYTGTEPFNSAVSTISTGNITYTSSNQEVATIDSKGIVTIIGVGETTIKASIEATATHKAGAINYTLIVRNASAELPYSTDFKSGLGDWINYTLAGTTVWESTTYGAQANGHGKGASEVYLVSPSVKAPNIILAFSSEKGYTGNDLQLFYSTDFDPSSMSQPSDASWTEITDKATWATSQETTESGNIELNNLTAPIRFAFKYTCTAEESARWTITNLSISANNSTGIEEATANEMKVINGKGQITIETDEAMPIAIYALTGAQVRQIELVEGTNIIELPAGIYLIGNKKVVVF